MNKDVNNIVRLDSTEQLSDCYIGDDYPLIEPGIYDLKYDGHVTWNMFGNTKAPKVTFWFRIMDYGEYFNTRLPRYYNADHHIGRKGKSGKFKAGKKSDFLREYFNVFPSNSVKRLERIPLSCFKTVIIRGRIETVTRDYKQWKRQAPLHYSVIRELEEVKKI